MGGFPSKENLDGVCPLMNNDPKNALQRVFARTRTQNGLSGTEPKKPLGTRQLWGETFTLVENGLNPDQVDRFVNDLLTRYKRLEDKGDTSTTVNTYLQKVMGEINQVEQTMTDQIRREAEAQAATLLADTREQARNIIAQAQKEAGEFAATESRKHKEASRKKAEAAEGQIRLQVQLMLEKAQEQLRNDLRQEGAEAYRRLQMSLQDMARATQQIEDQWNRQSARLWDEKDFRVILEDETPTSRTPNERDA
jgi:cell division septum initiation protein DivIVA